VTMNVLLRKTSTCTLCEEEIKSQHTPWNKNVGMIMMSAYSHGHEQNWTINTNTHGHSHHKPRSSSFVNSLAFLPLRLHNSIVSICYHIKTLSTIFSILLNMDTYISSPEGIICVKDREKHQCVWQRLSESLMYFSSPSHVSGHLLTQK